MELNVNYFKVGGTLENNKISEGVYIISVCRLQNDKLWSAKP